MLDQAKISLTGLITGDSFGANVDYQTRKLPNKPWRWTDDSEMAMALVEILDNRGHCDQDEFVKILAKRYWNDPNKGYGPSINHFFWDVFNEYHWSEANKRQFKDGSCGNGAAMRVAPLGAFFANDVSRLIEEAKLSSEVTHCHPEGVAGTVAVALSSCWAWRCKHGFECHDFHDMVEFVIKNTPNSQLKEKIRQVHHFERNSVQEAVQFLGNGCPITAIETVPFCVWCASRNLQSYENAIWEAFSAGGDMDTICAIVGGIVSVFVGIEGIPKDWLSLPSW